MDNIQMTQSPDIKMMTQDDREDMARDVVIFLTMRGPHYGSALYRHFGSLGKTPPNWMTDIIPDKPHTPPMQCFADVIAKLYEPEISDIKISDDSQCPLLAWRMQANGKY